MASDPLTMADRKIKLVLSDVDGTLLTRKKELTQRTIAAVAALRKAGIGFHITSSRPARGLKHLIQPLDPDTPIAAFNGGQMVDPDLNILEACVLPEEVARETLKLLDDWQVDAWVFAGNDWLVRDRNGPLVDHEAYTVRFEPVIVDGFAAVLGSAVKIVGACHDHDRLAACEQAAKERLGDRATAMRSQAYYLDVTDRNANKGAVVDYLVDHRSIPRDAIATIGDHFNDVAMFRRGGFSIAMGNAPEEVKKQAAAVTASCDEDGFAKAVEDYILTA